MSNYPALTPSFQFLQPRRSSMISLPRSCCSLQYRIARRRALLVLASGYLFTSLTVIPWALAFPGVFSPTGLLGGGLQTAAWQYTYWHVGSPLFLIVAVLLKDLDNKPSKSQWSPGTAVGLSVAVVTVTVFGLSWIAIAGEHLLPAIMLPDGVLLNETIATSLSCLIVVLRWRRARLTMDQTALRARPLADGGLLCMVA